MGTKIEYVDESINPIRTKDGGWHCVKSSTGCLNCYAEGINKRFGDKRNYGIVGAGQKPVELVLNRKALNNPLKWKKSKRIFIQDMSDLFLPGIDCVQDEMLKRSYFEAIRQIWLMIRHCEWHNFIILTKYPQRMYDFYKWAIDKYPSYGFDYPNLWLGVTCENQEQADKRIPILLQIPAAVRFISVEPMLSAIDLTKICLKKSNGGVNGNKPDITFDALAGWHGGANRPEKTKLDWCILGGESGTKARPMHPDWARGVRDRCVEAGVSYFFKQWGEWGADWRVKQGYCKAINVGTDPDNGPFMYKVGKKAAGRELDGKIWSQFPET